MVQTLGKLTQCPVFCSQIRLKTTPVHCKWKKKVFNCVRAKRGNVLWARDGYTVARDFSIIPFSSSLSAFCILIIGYVLFNICIHVRARARTPIYIQHRHVSVHLCPAPLPGFLKLTFLASRGLWSGQWELARLTGPSPEKEDLSGCGGQC